MEIQKFHFLLFLLLHRTVPLGMEMFNPVIFLDLQNGEEANSHKRIDM